MPVVRPGAGDVQVQLVVEHAQVTRNGIERGALVRQAQLQHLANAHLVVADGGNIHADDRAPRVLVHLLNRQRAPGLCQKLRRIEKRDPRVLLQNAVLRDFNALAARLYALGDRRGDPNITQHARPCCSAVFAL